MATLSHLSHSTLDNLKTCGMKVKLAKVDGVPRWPGWASIGGSAVHAVTETLDYRDFGIETGGPETFADAFAAGIEKAAAESPDIPEADWSRSGRVSKENPNKEDRAWWERHGQGMVNAWRGSLRSGPYSIATLPDGTPAIEVAWEAEFGGAKVVGYIDRIMTPGPTVVDLKTGARTPTNARQLGLYAVALERAGLAEGIKWGMFYDARHGKFSEPHFLDKYADGRLDYEFAIGARMVEHDLFLPIQSNLCASCDVRHYCPDYQGPKSEGYPEVKP